LPIGGSDGETHGVLYTGSIAPNAFDDEETKFLGFIAAVIGLTVQRLNRAADLDITTEMNSCAVATFMSSTHGLDQTYAAILDGIGTIAQTEECALMLCDPIGGKIRTVLLRGQYAGQESKFHCQMGEGIAGRSLEMGKPAFETEMGENTLPFTGASSYKSWLALPLRTIQGQPLGVINIWLNEAKRLPSRRFDVALTFATRAAMALENAMERERLKKGADQRAA
jgi:putative methionine-R-sulfoxide reductase with GAF domain